MDAKSMLRQGSAVVARGSEAVMGVMSALCCSPHSKIPTRARQAQICCPEACRLRVSDDCFSAASL